MEYIATPYNNYLVDNWPPVHSPDGLASRMSMMSGDGDAVRRYIRDGGQEEAEEDEEENRSPANQSYRSRREEKEEEENDDGLDDYDECQNIDNYLRFPFISN